MERITDKHLTNMLDRINAATGSPKDYLKDGKIQVGNHHIYGAYGLVAMHRTVNEAGGADDMTGLGTKRDLHNMMRAYLKGVEAME